MKRLLILSGKGGTGKTTVASAIISFSGAKAYADCDVDAPNLHLVTDQDCDFKENDYMGSQKAFIDNNKCIGCNACFESCRFNAIKIKDNVYSINEYSCEGCGVCMLKCPVNAINLKDDIAGKLMLSKENKVFSTAELKMGRGTSGKLVSEVKKQLTENTTKDIPFAVIDGSPGIGCPVIASISGVNVVLIVAEPSLSGISDMKRIIKTAKTFSVKVCVCVNKADTCSENAEAIKKYCKDNDIEFTGMIPFDSQVSEAVNCGRSIAGLQCDASKAVYNIYNQIKGYLV